MLTFELQKELLYDITRWLVEVDGLKRKRQFDRSLAFFDVKNPAKQVSFLGMKGLLPATEGCGMRRAACDGWEPPFGGMDHGYA